MSYWIDSSQKYSGYPTQRNFFCDTTDDIYSLPTSTTPGVQQGDDTVSCQIVSPGSVCYCISPTSRYILNSQNTWVKDTSGGGGGGGGGMDPADYWTINEVKAYVKSQEYVLPEATTTTLGGVKLSTGGGGITMDADGNMVVSTTDDNDIEDLFG